MSSKRIGLKEVAALAGVSLGSASKAMANPASVTSRTLEKVRAAAEQLGYSPHPAARALAGGRSDTIGVLIPTLMNNIYAAFTQAAQSAASSAGTQLFVTTYDYDREEARRNVKGLIRRGVDGLIIVGLRHDEELRSIIDHSGIPYVFGWSLDPEAELPCVGISHFEAARDIVRHLRDLGHENFAVVVVDPQYNDRARERLEGICQALDAAGLSIDDDHVITCSGSIRAGHEALSRLLALDEPPTAIIAGSDLIAAGAISEAISRGLEVPLELSVTGFDDVDFAALLTPPLTTVRVPSADLGKAAVELLMESLNAQKIIRAVSFPCDLILRGSTGPARKAGLRATIGPARHKRSSHDREPPP